MSNLGHVYLLCIATIYVMIVNIINWFMSYLDEPTTVEQSRRYCVNVKCVAYQSNNSERYLVIMALTGNKMMVVHIKKKTT